MDSNARTYSKSRLKAHMLEIMRELELTGEEAIITDHGRPVLRIVPIHRGRSVSEVFLQYRKAGKLKFLEPPDTPTAEEWGEV
jgi:antitoxin (DNA-binding transcriptional repressor) of toxin-antitoxin stability system